MQKYPLKPLFIGNFLSATRGTIGPTESLVKNLRREGITASLCSTKEHKLLRAIDIITRVLFSAYNLLCIDVFTGNLLRLLPVISPLAKLRRKPLVYVLHGGQLPEVYERETLAVQKIFSMASALVTPSLYLKSYFEERGFQVHYLPNSISLQEFPYASPVIDATVPKLLWVRAFSSIYNPCLAIETLDILKVSYPGISLTMIGPDAGLLAQVQELVIQKGLSQHVHFIGPVPNNQLGAYYRSHSVFINTTAYESFGVAVLEAAASGIPVVSLNVGNLPLIWADGAEIKLVESHTATAMANTITTVFENPVLAQQMSVQARKKAEQFTIEAILPQWQILLNGLLGQ